MSQLAQKRVLVASNAPTLFKLLNLLLTGEGYQVT